MRRPLRTAAILAGLAACTSARPATVGNVATTLRRPIVVNLVNRTPEALCRIVLLRPDLEDNVEPIEHLEPDASGSLKIDRAGRYHLQIDSCTSARRADVDFEVQHPTEIVLLEPAADPPPALSGVVRVIARLDCPVADPDIRAAGCL